VSCQKCRPISAELTLSTLFEGAVDAIHDFARFLTSDASDRHCPAWGDAKYGLCVGKSRQLVNELTERCPSRPCTLVEWFFMMLKSMELDSCDAIDTLITISFGYSIDNLTDTIKVCIQAMQVGWYSYLYRYPAASRVKYLDRFVNTMKEHKCPTTMNRPANIARNSLAIYL
jgi:hypothetical protein